MNKLMSLKRDADVIIKQVLQAAQPDMAVRRALQDFVFAGKKLHIIAAGKAAWTMAKAALDTLGNAVTDGIVITKYHHSKGDLAPLQVFEAGHPTPDINGFAATEAAIRLAQSCGEDDTVLFLLSGGGSALFESPLIPGQELADITGQMLSCGMSITEINTIRKRLSKVKGGRFAQICHPARVFSIVLSDIVGDPLDMIASGPCVADTSTCEEALSLVQKYSLHLSDTALQCLHTETPKAIYNVQTVITGSVSALCQSAAAACEQLGYNAVILRSDLQCEAKAGGEWLAKTGLSSSDMHHKQAFIVGGETVVRLTGSGKGGRNQEFALSAAKIIDGHEGVLLFSLGSDGTDGPTDAAGGMVTWQTANILKNMHIDIDTVLQQNDSYHALKAADALIVTGPTGTNVNDVAVLLIDI